MDIFDAIYGRRSIRKFKRIKVEKDMLNKLVDCARFAPSGANMQSLKYYIVREDDKVETVFAHTKWAGYLKGLGSPTSEERPAAFIIMVNDQAIKKEGYMLDAGAAAQTILLAAYGMGLDGCWLGAIDRSKIRNIINLDEKYEIISALALGYADMESVWEDTEDDIKYYLDENDVLHVPKRKQSSLILNEK